MVPGSSPGEPTTYFINIKKLKIFHHFSLDFKIFLKYKKCLIAQNLSQNF